MGSQSLKGIEGYVKRGGDIIEFDPRLFIRDENRNTREPGSYGKDADDQSLKEYIRQNGMKSVGILSGQKMPDGTILLRKGFRRHWAAMELIAEGEDIKTCLLKLVDKNMTDDEALFEALADGQSKRESPFEEARAFLRLKNNGHDVKEIATRLGKSLPYIYDRLKLINATPETREAVKTKKVGVTVASKVVASSGGDPGKQAQAIHKASVQKKRATIGWDKKTQCLISKGFTDEQESVIAELMPRGFTDKLSAVGLDPETLKFSVAVKV